MSIRAIEASPELLRLRDEGYGVRVEADVLLVGPIPYLDSTGNINLGTLAKEVQFDAEHRASLGDHTMYFIGGMPYHFHGQSMQDAIVADTNEHALGGGHVAQMRFSSKPDSGKYDDVYQQVTRYAALLSNPAREKDPESTPKTFPPLEDKLEETPFLYPDSSSTRAGIRAIAEKLEGQRIAIVGLGGTGSYILDFIAKTRVAQIHLFDADYFEPHSAYRAPGAASLQELKPRPRKVDYLAAIYSKQKRGVTAHPTRVTADNVTVLSGMSFVFIAIDRPADKIPIMAYLHAQRIPFVDVGMGLHVADSSIDGTVRSIRVLNGEQDPAMQHISTAEDTPLEEYNSNIQIAELGALNAALAVLHWKKQFGFYVDDSMEYLTRFIPGTASLLRIP
ncbi:MAG: ThiF family adenylyltransferase [Thermoplasmatota archaeon]